MRYCVYWWFLLCLSPWSHELFGTVIQTRDLSFFVLKMTLVFPTLFTSHKTHSDVSLKVGFPLEEKKTHRNSPSLSWIDFFKAVQNKRKQTRSFNTFISWWAGCPLWVLEKMPDTNVFETYLLRWIEVQIKQHTLRKLMWQTTKMLSLSKANDG